MLTDKIQGLIKSRRFWVAVAGVAVTFSDTFGLALDPDTIQPVSYTHLTLPTILLV